MKRYLLNPTFSIETGELLSHDGEFWYDNPGILFDRGVTKTASQSNKNATSQGNANQANANQVYGTVVPGIEQQANNPTGYAPTDINNMLVSSQEAAGGAGAGTAGAARLGALRTRNAGGFAPALDEASRNRTQTLSSNALDVANMNARLKQQQQQTARQQLLGLYGTNTNAALASMGLANQDLNTQLAGGRQGWLQNTEGALQTLGNLGLGSAKAAGFG